MLVAVQSGLVTSPVKPPVCHCPGHICWASYKGLAFLLSVLSLGGDEMEQMIVLLRVKGFEGSEPKSVPVLKLWQNLNAALVPRASVKNVQEALTLWAALGLARVSTVEAAPCRIDFCPGCSAPPSAALWEKSFQKVTLAKKTKQNKKEMWVRQLQHACLEIGKLFHSVYYVCGAMYFNREMQSVLWVRFTFLLHKNRHAMTVRIYV